MFCPWKLFLRGLVREQYLRSESLRFREVTSNTEEPRAGSFDDLGASFSKCFQVEELEISLVVKESVEIINAHYPQQDP